MHDLTAQVTSSLLPFPAVTVEALGEDEITLDSVLHGKFSIGRGGLAWLACGPHLEVAHAVTGERLSAYCFSSGGEHPPTVLAARDFSWLKRSGLLVGLEEAEGSVLCLYDLGLSRVVKAVVIPGRITAIEPLVSCGGASTSTQHLHQSLRWFFGIAAVVTDLGHVLLVDLCLDDLSCSQTELEASDLQVVTKSPAEIPRLREVSSREGRHLCLQLNAPTGVGATALQYISRTNQLAVGFSDGYLQLWNMKALKKEYHSQLEGGRVPVHAFTFQEPENDPRNCCYLWAVQSSQDLEGDMVSLHLLQLAYSERKCLASGKILYEGLEYCEERYSQELSSTAFPLRAQTTSTRLLSCQTIEKFRPHPDRDESMNEVASPDISVSIFSWQVKAYGQGAPSTYIGVFDINRWYHAQMPDSLRAGESLQNCPYLAVWCMDPVVQMVSPHILLDVVVHDRSLSRGLPLTCPPPEQYFNPTTYNFDATCLLNSGIVHLTCSGYQKETLSFLKKAAPCSSEVISTSYSRCLMSGLLSSRLSDTQPSSLSQEEQLDAILSTAVETSSLGLITGCIKQWTAEEQPGSALNLRYILDWAWKKVVLTKEELDGICAPLFDSSSNFTDPQTMQLLQHSQRLLGNLSTIFHCLLSEAQELTQKGLVGLINKNMVSSLISKYAQVVLWFCRTGLLPEGSDDNVLQFSRPFYTHSVINSYYTIRREELSRLAKGKWCADCLMIDGLVGQCGEQLSNLWKRDDGGTGQYPPPTLHALLDIYLLDNIEEATKHAIVIYLLLDVMYSFPNKEGASVESFPTAFAIPIGLVKLVQGLWLLDHHDHQSSFELLLHPAASQCQFEWQHERVLQALMCQGQHPVALRYFQVTKPPISSTAQAKLCLSVLLHNRCLIEAWALLRQHSNHLNLGELLAFLYESCQELNLIKELLKLPLGLNEQGCLEKFLQGTGGLHNRELLMVHYLQQANYIPALQLNHSLKMNLVNERDPKLKERSNSRNSILDQYGKVLPRVQRKLAMERAKPYQHPSTIHKEVSRPQPLSTITKRSATEKVVSRAGFINNVLTKIEEVWLGKGASPQPSPAKRAPQFQSPDRKATSGTPPDPFLGTPIMTSKRKSRLMDLVVHPASQTPRPLLCPPRPPGSWVSPKSSTKAPELSLLQTPQVVKRARALAASGPVFPAFTPQSILRSSLRPTPVATPSASPGRSITPPLRGKESRITFIGEEESPEPEKSIRWTNGMAADSEISLLTRGATVSKAMGKTWSSQASKEDEEDEEREQLHVKFLPPDGGIPSPQLGCLEEESLLPQEASPADGAKTQLTLSFNTSQTFTCSTDTTLEYYDAPLSADQGGGEGLSVTDKEDEIVTLNIRHLTESNQPEQNCLTSIRQTPPLPSINAEVEEPERAEGETLEEVTKVGVNEEDENEGKDVRKLEDENEELTGIEDAVHSYQEDIACHNQENNQETDGMDVNEQPSNAGYLLVNADERPDADIQSELTEATAFLKKLNESENTEPTKEPVEESADLTDFVQRHLFGSGLSPPLTRSGIHSSRNETTFNSEPPDVIEDKEPAAAEAPPVFTSQKSTVSVTSSEPTGTDSHSVVSVNDSEELSSPASGDEDEDEEDGEESDQAEEEEEEEEEEGEEEEEEEMGEEEEDSGSEVEIIEEVQGNGRLQPSSVFIPPDHTHFLPTLSEQAAAELSLIAPDTEMKMIEDEMEGEVVMVRLGADAGQMETHEDMEQGSSFMELKPSTTLLVPLELVEGQQDMLGAGPLDMPELQQTIVPDEQPCDSQCSFSLMLDMDEDGDKDALSVESDQQSSKLPSLTAAVEATENFVAKSEVILLSLDEQDTLGSVDVVQEDKRKELEKMAEAETDGRVETEHQDDPHPEITEVTQKIEDAEEQTDSTLQTAQEMPEPQISSALVQELAEVFDGKDASEEDNSETVEDQKERIEMEATAPHADASTPVEEQDHGSTSETVEDKVAEAEAEEDTMAGPVIEEEKVAEVEMEEDKMAGPVIEEDKVTEVTTKDKMAEAVMEDKAEAGTEEDKLAANDTGEDEVAQHTETVEDEALEAQPKKETTRTTRAMSREDGGVEEDEQVLSSSSRTEEQPAPPPQKKAPSTPTRRATRASRAVSFVSPPVEEDQGAREAPIPASLSQTPRKTKQNKETITQGGTPRRSTRITQPEAAEAAAKDEEVMDADQTAANTSVSASPSRRRTSQRKTSTRSSLRTRSSSKEEEPAATGLDEEKDEVPNRKASRQTPSKTPAKGAGPPLATPRRSTRKVLNNSEMPQTPLDVVREEEEIEVSVPAVKRSTRKTKIRAAEPEMPQEEEAKIQPAPSPSRSSRQSNRIGLDNYSKIARKTGGETVTENSKVSEDLTEHNSSSTFTANRRPTRTKLWDHPQEDLFLLDSPLEVDSETPVADALIKRLQDEEEKQEGEVVVQKMVRGSKRSTRSSVDPAKEEPLPESNSDEHSFIYSPSRRRTRASQAEHPGPSDAALLPVTRSTRRKNSKAATKDETPSEEDNDMELEKAKSVSKTRKTGKRTAKSKAVLEPPPLAHVDLLSPLPSPVDPAPRAQKRTKDAEAPVTSTINLRRKRIMNIVFNKPVTRRKKL